MNNHIYIINKNIIFNAKECYLCTTRNNMRELIGANPSVVLQYLIKSQGETISLDEISNFFMSKGRVVNAATTIQYISKLRKTFKALGETTTVIETIKGGGYYIPRYIVIAETHLSDTEKITQMTQGVDGAQEEPEPGVIENDYCLNNQQDVLFSRVTYFLLLINCLLFFFITKSLISPHFREINYRLELEHNGCSVYADHDFPEKDSALQTIIFKDIDMLCKSKSYAYLTYIDYSKSYSIFVCNSPLVKGSKKNICSSITRLNND